jgi:hypothetical protein
VDYLVVPFDTGDEFATKSKVQVKGTIDGQPYRSTLLPTGDGKHFLVVKSDIRKAIGKQAGQRVAVTLERDEAGRSVLVPRDLSKALNGDAKAKGSFEKMANSHRKAYVEWIAQAKKEETRDGRIKKAIGMIKKGSSAR